MNWTESEYAAYQRRLQDRHPDTLFEPTEADFLAQVRAHAKQQGWLFFHTHDARGSEPGFPDCVFLLPPGQQHQGRLVFAELKSRIGKLTAEQALWINLLQKVSGIECYLWRPGDWDVIVEVLTPSYNKATIPLARRAQPDWPGGSLRPAP